MSPKIKIKEIFNFTQPQYDCHAHLKRRKRWEEGRETLNLNLTIPKNILKVGGFSGPGSK